mmetsp:Transcript_13442/g.24129  ORF Transcript_13442/g.24129 Transcript_13442/m.24129 type:complete len:110 (+) Transcript_13442:110-439(+)
MTEEPLHSFNSTGPRYDMDIIPKELQLPIVIVVGLLGFLLVLGLSKLSARSDPKAVQFDKKSSAAAPSTPMKTPTKKDGGTPIEEKTGTVMTPAGRRSARIARTRRKED